MLVTVDGRYVEREIRADRDADALAAAHLAGVAADAELRRSRKRRTANPLIVKQFARNYRRYQKQIVNPMARRVRACDYLLVLIDIATLLAGGGDVYDGCEHVLEESFRYLAPGGALPVAKRGLNRLARLFSGGRLGFHSLHRIGVVVTQADRVHRDDREKLKDLAEQMIEPLLSNALLGRQMPIEYFVCTAVNSSVSRDYPYLEVRTRGEPRATRVEVGNVPDSWPDDWPPACFHFPPFPPVPPARLGRPPTQFGLDGVASFILGIA